MKKNKKDEFVDDGRTIYPMDCLYEGKKPKKDVNLTRKERRAMHKAINELYLTRTISILLGFLITFLLLYLWLK